MSATIVTSFDKLPAEIKALNTWVGWRLEDKTDARGKVSPTKPPYDLKPNKTLRHANTADSLTWATFETANEQCFGFSTLALEGVGVVLPVGWGGLDFDGCIIDGQTEPYVLEILRHFGNPYTEISPSGNGLRAFFNAPTLPTTSDGEIRCKFNGKKKGVNKYAAEIYFGGHTNRYLTVTGDKVGGDGVPTPQDIDFVYFLMSQFGNEKFKRLWMGDTSMHDDDNSKADLALCGMLVRLLQGDAQRVEKYFGASILGQRDKWTERKDYRDSTIAKALSDYKPEPQNAAEPGNISTATSPKASRHELVFRLPAVKGTHRDYVIAPVAGQKDGWFPRGNVSLIAGSSGGTKTTLANQLLVAQRNKLPFYGHVTYGRLFLTIGVDRGEFAYMRTMERMNMSLASVPFKPLSTEALDFNAVQDILNIIESTVPLPEIVFVEGMDMMLSENVAKRVTPFVHALSKIAQHYHIAIIGSVGSPKTQEGKSFAGARDNVIGSTAWGRTVETIALLQFPKGDDTSIKRKLTVMLRNGPAEKFFLKLQDGLLEIDPDAREEGSEEDVSEQESREIDWYRTQARLAKTNPAKRWFTIMDMERALHLKHSTADYHVKNHRTKGYLKKKSGTKGGRGSAAEYSWNDSKTNPLWAEQQAQEVADQLDVF